MALIPGSVRFTGFIAPTDSTDTFPVFKPIYGLGGMRSVASTTERDAITTQRREVGMIVYVSANTTYYTLGSGLTNSDWTVFTSGSGSAGNFLPLSGGTVTGSTTFNAGLSATTFTSNSISGGTLSGGTILSGSTNLYAIFAPFGGSGSYNQPGSNITTGGTSSNQIISVVASPSFNNLNFSGTALGNNLSANTISATTIYSGSSDLSTLFLPITASFVNGTGSANYISLWSNSNTLASSTIYEDPITGITIFNNVAITGDLSVLGTAYTYNQEIIQTSDNLIILNFSGTNISAIGGGLYLISGQTSGAPSVWVTDNFGNWSANTQIIAGGGLNVNTGTTLSSGGTDLYNIFSQGSGTTTYATTLTGISASTTYTITHSLGSTDIVPALWNQTTGDLIYAKVTNRLTNAVDVIFTSAPGADVRVVIKK